MRTDIQLDSLMQQSNQRPGRSLFQLLACNSCEPCQSNNTLHFYLYDITLDFISFSGIPRHFLFYLSRFDSQRALLFCYWPNEVAKQYSSVLHSECIVPEQLSFTLTHHINKASQR